MTDITLGTGGTYTTWSALCTALSGTTLSSPTRILCTGSITGGGTAAANTLNITSDSTNTLTIMPNTGAGFQDSGPGHLCYDDTRGAGIHDSVAGSMVTINTNFLTITGMQFRNSSTSNNQVIAITSYTPGGLVIIKNCIFSSAQAYYGISLTKGGVTFTNNCCIAEVQVNSPFTSLASGDTGSVFYNNIFAAPSGSSGTGLSLACSGSPIVRNNIIVGFTAPIYDGNANIVADGHNATDQASLAAAATGSQTSISYSTTNFKALSWTTPFGSSSTLDLRPTANAPAFAGLGSSSGAPTKDIFNTTYNQSTYDIGAVDITSSSIAWQGSATLTGAGFMSAMWFFIGGTYTGAGALSALAGLLEPTNAGLSGTGLLVNGPPPTTLTTFTLASTSASAQTNIVYELMVPAAPSALNASSVLITSDSGYVQTDLTRTDANGSVRLQKIVGVHSSLAGNASTTQTIYNAIGGGLPGTPIAASDLLAAHIGGSSGDQFEVSVICTFPDGTAYEASARAGLAASATWTYGQACNRGTFRSGPYITEFIVQVPLTHSGTPHAFLLAEFHITAAKAGTAPYDYYTNPILWTRTRLVLINGYMLVANPDDLFYNLQVKTGYNTPITTYTLDDNGLGTVTTNTITLSSVGSSTNTVVTNATATAVSAVWAAKNAGYTVLSGTSLADNAQHVGKALVEVSGSATGRAWINDMIDGTQKQANITIGGGHQFSSLSITSWKVCGVYHQCWQTVRIPNIIQGTYPNYNAILATSYLISTEMFMNWSMNAATIPLDSAPGPKEISYATAVTADGSHPTGMSSTNSGGTVRGWSIDEGETGGRDEIGVIPGLHTACVLNWSSNYSMARFLLEESTQWAARKPYMMLDETTGGLIGIDKAGIYVLSGGPSTTQPNLIQYYGSRIFKYRLDHTASPAYAPYVLTGEYEYLKHILQNTFYASFIATDYALVNNSGSVSYGDAINELNGAYTIFTISIPPIEFTTGEAVALHYDGYSFSYNINGGSNGTYQNLPANPILYIRVLSSSTFSLYDTATHALAGGTVGIVTLTGNNSNKIKIFNGRNRLNITIGA